MAHTVYVVAWRYDTGVGFDWYTTKEAADKAFIVEQKNAREPQLAEANWTPYRFDYTTPTMDADKITDEIDAQLGQAVDGEK